MSKKPYSVRTGVTGAVLYDQGTPVFNLTSGTVITRAETPPLMGAARPATLVEILAYRRKKSPHLFC